MIRLIRFRRRQPSRGSSKILHCRTNPGRPGLDTLLSPSSTDTLLVIRNKYSTFPALGPSTPLHLHLDLLLPRPDDSGLLPSPHPPDDLSQLPSARHPHNPGVALPVFGYCFRLRGLAHALYFSVHTSQCFLFVIAALVHPIPVHFQLPLCYLSFNDQGLCLYHREFLIASFFVTTCANAISAIFDKLHRGRWTPGYSELYPAAERLVCLSSARLMDKRSNS